MDGRGSEWRRPEGREHEVRGRKATPLTSLDGAGNWTATAAIPWLTSPVCRSPPGFIVTVQLSTLPARTLRRVHCLPQVSAIDQGRIAKTQRSGESKVP